MSVNAGFPHISYLQSPLKLWSAHLAEAQWLTVPLGSQAWAVFISTEAFTEKIYPSVDRSYRQPAWLRQAAALCQVTMPRSERLCSHFLLFSVAFWFTSILSMHIFHWKVKLYSWLQQAFWENNLWAFLRFVVIWQCTWTSEMNTEVRPLMSSQL